ncbi:MAG: GDP-L-fucose synthase [Saprospiraceae bacterium]|nr:GDP-L-fucose synthase [Saprospiraceae bacterium]
MDTGSKIYVAGHSGMVGSAITRVLEKAGYHNLILRRSSDLDLRNQSAVTLFMETERPEYIFLAAAKVGGILANNKYRADFLYDNLMIEANVIHTAFKTSVKKLLFLGSSCIYPKLAAQPLKEDALLTGLLEPTNEPYAIAKIAGIKLCDAYRAQHGCNFISAMPTNLYGPNDNYDLQTSHVLPALLRKFHEAKKNHESKVVLWGSGTPRREFMHVDDVADACMFLMREHDSEGFLNVGTGKDITIRDLALMIKGIVGYAGQIVQDINKPDGTPRKLMNVDRLAHLGWKAKIDLEHGLRLVYEECKDEDWY